MKIKEEKVKMRILITSLILALFIVGTMGIVSAQEEIPTKIDGIDVIVIEKPTLWETIKSFFSTTDFTIVGQDRKCSVTPDWVWGGKLFSEGEAVLISGMECKAPSILIENPPFPDSEEALYNVYSSSDGFTWTKKFEISSTEAYFYCNYDYCKIEIYCCPHPECISDSQCKLWEGTGSTCEIKTEVDPWMPLKDREGNIIGSYNYCAPLCVGASIECWQLYQDTCQKTTYSCNYETWPDCPPSWPYTSKSQCEVGIFVPECTNGEKKCAGTILTECVNQQWVEKGRVEGECGYDEWCKIEGENCLPLFVECCDSLSCAFGFDTNFNFKCVSKTQIPGEITVLDSDGDGYTDVYEIELGSDPFNKDSIPTDESKDKGKVEECIVEEGLFYTDGEFSTTDSTWVLIWETTSGDVVNPGQLDEHFPGFSRRYKENKATACCEGLKPSLIGEKIREYASGILFFTIDKGTLSYLQYKCIPEEEVGFCLEFAHLWINPITKSDDCQMNTIILGVLVIFGFIVIARFAGMYGEVKYEHKI